MKNISSSIALMLSMLVAQAQLPAFPDAQGFGSFSVHGRGGKVIVVTNLNDNGAGSLRAAIETPGKRIIVFKVGGIINLATKLNVFEPYCLIAGQTAPGDGICLKGSGLNIAAHDVVVRYIRSRPSDGNGENPEDRDGIQVYPYPAYQKGYSGKVYNIIIDHCSVSWGVDESMSFYGSLVPNTNIEVRDISVQWSIISETLYNSIHPEGGHSMGILVGGGAHRISFVRNLLAHNSERHPLFKTGTNGKFINNVMYNCPQGIGFINEDGNYNHPNSTSLDIIGNYAKEGFNSVGKGHIMSIGSQYLTKNAKFYVQDNICKSRTLSTQNEWAAIKLTNLDEQTVKSAASTMDSPPVIVYPTIQAYDSVLAKVGCILPKRDIIDARIINEVKEGTGKIIDSPTQVGGYPNYATGTAYIDTDKDGMADIWEAKYCFDTKDATDGNKDEDDDGYTNVEEFLNGTQPSTCIVTNVKSIHSNDGISIFPNPAKTELFVSGFDFENTKYEITSIEGKACQSGVVTKAV